MFDSFLTCRAFALPENRASRYAELARQWSGNSDLENSPDGSFHWVSHATVDIDGTEWASSVSNLKIETHNSLVPLGQIEDDEAFVVVSSDSGLATAFRAAVLPYLRGEGDNQKVGVKGLVLDLDELASAPTRDFLRSLRGVEGISVTGDRVSWTISPSSLEKHLVRAPVSSWRVVKIEVSGKTAVIDTNFDIKLEGVLHNSAADVSGCLVNIFGEFRDHISVRKIPRAHTFG